MFSKLSERIKQQWSETALLVYPIYTWIGQSHAKTFIIEFESTQKAKSYQESVGLYSHEFDDIASVQVDHSQIIVEMCSSDTHPRAGIDTWQYNDLVKYHQNYHPNNELASWNNTWFLLYQTGIGLKPLFVRLFAHLTCISPIIPAILAFYLTSKAVFTSIIVGVVILFMIESFVAAVKAQDHLFESDYLSLTPTGWYFSLYANLLITFSLIVIIIFQQNALIAFAIIVGILVAIFLLWFLWSIIKAYCHWLYYDGMP